MSWPTSRRHPRSMAEAFPADYADPIEHHKAVLWHGRVVDRILITAAAVLAVWALIAFIGVLP